MFHHCQRCGDLAQSAGQTVFCRCGWSHSQTVSVESLQKKVVLSLFLSSCLFVGLLFHFLYWGGHSLAIVIAGPEKKLEICMKLKRFQCVEESYQALFNKTGNLKTLNRLGQFQFERGRYKAASKTYSQYFSEGGKYYMAAYYYAHALVKTGRLDRAIFYFEGILKGRNQGIKMAVLESYLNVLISHNRRKRAKAVLVRAKRRAKGSHRTQSQIVKWEKQFNI